ncbi:hypothetical protein [Mycobacterium tilburgii]|uniref:hypothetical protein n=1 Tax=Mycobacterium tilburgii TaxID=44467 RepID=UPI0011840596|nr:hypothetical protein [Mycobacterium tilburgii]
MTSQQLAPWLFDAELAVEWVANAGRQAASIAAGDHRDPGRHPHGTGRRAPGLAQSIRIPSLAGLQLAA